MYVYTCYTHVVLIHSQHLTAIQWTKCTYMYMHSPLKQHQHVYVGMDIHLASSQLVSYVYCRRTLTQKVTPAFTGSSEWYQSSCSSKEKKNTNTESSDYCLLHCSDQEQVSYRAQVLASSKLSCASHAIYTYTMYTQIYMYLARCRPTCTWTQT